MAISYYATEEDALGHYRVRKLKGGYVVTTDHSAWAFLTEAEMAKLRREELSEPLSSVLRDKGIILNQSNVDQVVKDYRQKYDFLFKGTSLHIIVPTLRCNQDCIYCHACSRGVKEKGYDMDEETAKKTVDFILQSPSEPITIEFQGGEPLLNFDIVKFVVKYAKEKNPGKNLNFTIVTNLVELDDEKLDFLKRENVGICTSLDGPAHDKNRGHHALVKKQIKKILKDYKINAMSLTTKHSLPYAKETVDEYHDLGLDRIWIKPVNNLGRAMKNWKGIQITAQEFLDFWKKALARVVELNKDKVFIENHTRILLRKILTKDCVNFTDLQSPCGAAIGQLAYSYDGSVYTCDEGRLFEIFQIGTVDDRYNEVVTSPGSCAVVRASINDNPVCEICAYKPFCGLCPVCSYAQTNNIIPKLPDQRCEILIGMFDHIFEKLLNDKEYRRVFMSWVGES